MITRCCQNPAPFSGSMEFLKTNMTIWKAFPCKKLPAREAGIYALYPGVNLDNTLDFIISFQTIDRCINHSKTKTNF